MAPITRIHLFLFVDLATLDRISQLQNQALPHDTFVTLAGQRWTSIILGQKSHSVSGHSQLRGLRLVLIVMVGSTKWW